jgi:dTDP-4-amino-4,6-dideoxygalactose transaminase
MDFIDLKAQQKRIKEQLDANIQRVLAHGNYIMGPEVKELEKQLAAYVGAKHAVACASGTDALLMALMALDVGPGDAVFTTPFTFIATAEVIALLGATPVFVDIDPATYNIDPAKLEQAVLAVRDNDPARHPLPNAGPAASATPPTPASFTTPAAPLSPNALGKIVPRRAPVTPNAPLRPRAVIPVDLFGLPADYDAINAVAARYGLVVIEDAAQSFGAEYRGKKACALADVACSSFFPAKPLGCYGDGGMCFTDDDALAAALESIRVHGKGSHKYDNARIGINGRLDTLQAAILLAKFSIFPEEVELRNAAAAHYTEFIQNNGAGPGTSALVTPHVPAGYVSVWAQYSLLARDETHRTAIMDKLKAASIPTAIYYPKPLHLQTAFAPLGYAPGAFPVSEDAAARIFSLPMHPYLTAEDQTKIVEALGSK